MTEIESSDAECDIESILPPTTKKLKQSVLSFSLAVSNADTGRSGTFTGDGSSAQAQAPVQKQVSTTGSSFEII